MIGYNDRRKSEHQLPPFSLLPRRLWFTQRKSIKLIMIKRLFLWHALCCWVEWMSESIWFRCHQLFDPEKAGSHTHATSRQSHAHTRWFHCEVRLIAKPFSPTIIMMIAWQWDPIHMLRLSCVCICECLSVVVVRDGHPPTQTSVPLSLSRILIILHPHPKSPLLSSSVKQNICPINSRLDPYFTTNRQTRDHFLSPSFSLIPFLFQLAISRLPYIIYNLALTV